MVTASRDFVCVRPATYESAEEAAVLLSFFRKGELENTIFTLLAPNGKTQLTRGGRSPGAVFRDAAEMAEQLGEVARKYRPKDAARTPSVPLVEDVRRGLNVASCDNRPLVVVHAAEQDALEALLEKLAPVAWSDALVGRVRWAASSSATELASLDAGDGGILVVAPDEFGLAGRVVARLAPSASAEQLTRGLAEALALHRPEAKDQRIHARLGSQQGVEWESEIPATDGSKHRKR